MMIMATTSLLSVRVPSAVAERLAQAVERSKSWLAAEAIENEYLDLHEWQVKAIHEGLKEIEQGQVIDFIDVKKELGIN
jgi:predicted transcriptional regulator